MAKSKNNLLNILLNLDKMHLSPKQRLRYEAKKTAYIKKASELNLFGKQQINFKKNKRFETKTRQHDPASALLFAIHDPLWMLTRQWQFGEFKGNDTGSAIWTKIKIKHQNTVGFKNENGNFTSNDQTAAMEYFVERINHTITEGVKIEAAYHFKKILDYSSLEAISTSVLGILKNIFPFQQNTTKENISAQEAFHHLKSNENKALIQFNTGFNNKAFDGFALFIYHKQHNELHPVIKSGLEIDNQTDLLQLLHHFCAWFEKTYLPVVPGKEFWSNELLGYNARIMTIDKTKNNETLEYVAEDYHSGRLSWYSFDKEKSKENLETTTSQEERVKYFSYLPVLAEYPGAPNKRLWTFEDAKVSMGNSELSKQDVASAMVMQYTTMYSNDWLITPLELEVGQISSVEGILVTDVFGNKYYIDQASGSKASENARFSSRWEMFTIAEKEAYIKADFKTDGRLFYPPTVPRVEESTPIEEIQFLRDEMANLIWAVELKINDGTNQPLDVESWAGAIQTELQNIQPKLETTNETLEDSDYKYLLQNSVPINWIPFSPVRFEKGSDNYYREIRFQRSTMPLFFKEEYIPIRPNSFLLRTGVDSEDRVTAYLYINEEKVFTVGTKVAFNYQRTRWFDGKTYNWLGANKIQKNTQAFSELSFDELIEVIKSTKNLDLNK